MLEEDYLPTDGLIAGETGIFLNNRMGYFWLDANYPNVVEPGKRSFQTITPSIALKDGKPFMGWGTPGSDVQEQTKLQIFFDVIYSAINPQQAIEAPRFSTSNFPGAGFPHTATPGRVTLESRIPAKVIDELKAIGYDARATGEWSTSMGGAGFASSAGRPQRRSDFPGTYRGLSERMQSNQ